MNLPPVSIRARFERFPATVKGAFVIRGEDADPHQVVLKEARVSPVAGRGGRPLAMAPATLDVAPKQDVFVPFELTVSDLEPGWYGLECEVEVDGIPAVYPGGKRFTVPWPRASTRRGTIAVGKKVAVGARTSVLVERVECAADGTQVHLRVSPPGSISVRLLADGARLEILDAEFDESGRGKVSAYPLMKDHGALRVEFAGAGAARKGRGPAVDVRLP